jgi:hypothetical protein
MSSEVSAVAYSQDMIGWRNMMEGRVSVKFFSVQQAYLTTMGGRINGDDWMCGFISRLLNITHSQWLLRNFSLHDRVAGSRRIKERAEMLAHIEDLQTTDPNRVPDHSRFLLEIDMTRLKAGAYDTQAYWVAAMEAARGAQSKAVMGQLSRPPLTKYGVFSVQAEIRQETKDIRRGDTVTGWTDRVRGRPVGRAGGGMSGFTASDRCRKPD